MYPLTFLEFVDAMGINPSVIDTIYQSLENHKSIPTGIHEKFKKIVHFSCAKEVEIKCSEGKKLQSDGEVMENIKTLYVNRDKH